MKPSKIDSKLSQQAQSIDERHLTDVFLSKAPKAKPNHALRVIKKFCELSGYTDKAVRRKIQDHVWIERQHWRRAPHGHILIDLEANR